MSTNQEPSRRDALKAAGAVGIAALAGEAAGRAEDAVPVGLPQAKPEDIGLDPRRLQTAYDLLEKWTTDDDAPVPGGAILVGRGGKVVAPRLFGRQGSERGAGAIRKD